MLKGKVGLKLAQIQLMMGILVISWRLGLVLIWHTDNTKSL